MTPGKAEFMSTSNEVLSLKLSGEGVAYCVLELKRALCFLPAHLDFECSHSWSGHYLVLLL